jgi:hypothetical protein
MMKNIFSTAYAAPIDYYRAMLTSEVNLICLHEHFIKQTIRNRCLIATSNGILILTIPLNERKNNMAVHEIRISYKTDWQRQHIKSLETAYKASPFFEFYLDDLKTIYQKRPEYLLEWNQQIHHQIIRWLKMNHDLKPSTSYQKNYENAIDFRLKVWPKSEPLSYHQVFENKLGFLPNLSIYDLIFNCGNQALSLLQQ